MYKYKSQQVAMMRNLDTNSCLCAKVSIGKKFWGKNMVNGYYTIPFKWWVEGSFNSFTAKHSCITQIHRKLKVNSRGWFCSIKSILPEMEWLFSNVYSSSAAF